MSEQIIDKNRKELSNFGPNRCWWYLAYWDSVNKKTEAERLEILKVKHWKKRQ